MLTSSEARHRLESIERKDYREARSRAVRKLDRGGRRIADVILADDRRRRQPGRRQEIEVAIEIDTLKPRRRHKLFEALAPGHGEAVARGWSHLATGPYQHGWTRRPFRTPTRPEATLARRVLWLRQVSEVIWRYPGESLEWYVGWAPYLGGWKLFLGSLFASEIESGPEGDAVFGALLASMGGDHPVGMMGRHVSIALLGCSRPEGWEAVEKLLLAAQRQEGLRQVILEAVDEAHPEAFRRMVHLVRDERLTRFASVVRACNVWFGVEFDVARRATVDRLLATLVTCLEDPERRRAHLDGDDAEEAYVALWSVAFFDALAAVEAAKSMLGSENPSHRFAATYLLGQLELEDRLPVLLAQLEDPDAAVAWQAFCGLGAYTRLERHLDAYERLEAYFQRLPGQENLTSILWDWQELECDPTRVLQAMVAQLQPEDVLRAGDYVDRMDPVIRGMYATKVAKRPEAPDHRTALLALTGDRSQYVRQIAFEALAKHPVAEHEAPLLEKLLTRKTASVRRAVLAMLLTQQDGAVLASAQRLVDSSNAMQREAGFDLLRELVAAGRAVDKAQAIAARHAEGHDLSDQEELLKGAIAAADDVPSLENCLGLIDPANRTTPPQMVDRSPQFIDDRALKLLAAADAFVARHRDLPVRFERAVGSDTELYGDQRYRSPALMVRDEDSLPLTSLWTEWWHDVGRPLADNPANLFRALAAQPRQRHLSARIDAGLMGWERELQRSCHPDAPDLEYPGQAWKAIGWLARAEMDDDSITLLLDAAETTLARIPRTVRQSGLIDRSATHYQREWDWRTSHVLRWVALARGAFAGRPSVWGDEAIRRLWGLVRWLDEPSPSLPRRLPELEEVVAAFRIGAATDSDVIDHLVGAKADATYHRWGVFRDLGRVTRRRPEEFVESTPGLRELIDLTVERILEVELARGEMPTAASAPALALRSISGAERLVQFVKALGRRRLTRGWTWDVQATHSVLSHLIRVSVPAPDDTPERFAAAVASARIADARLLDVAVYAPQWAGFVQHALDWEGLEESVHWLHAHTKDSKWRVDADIRELWAAEVASRTPLSAADLTEGAVDVAWYRRCRAAIGDERWMRLDKAAKYASGGGGHKRAQLYAEALAGTLDEAALRTRIADKRHQDSVRALGLLPVPAAEPERTATLVDRYAVIQEFLRGSRRYGSQRRASEKRAAETGVDNLARTAGHRDPMRFQWAMETAAVADLAAGPVVVKREPYIVTLRVDAMGVVELTTTKDGKKLKSIPAKHRKDPEIAELRSRKKELGRQTSRMRQSLETAMVRGDDFAAEELRQLMQHPVLRPMLLRLVWRAAGGNLGYLDVHATSLRRHDGRQLDFGKDRLRIAHPHDLLESGEWSDWQHECFAAERIQPFKQVFREVYVVTDGELREGTLSRRYAGHQVNPRQAMALLGSRGWVAHPDDGPSKTFHDAGVTVWLGILGGWFTPAEVEGMTLEVVMFTRRGEWQPLPLTDVPPRIFSEAMRDLDLVVSVAHVGGVDPEASASTVEMRKALVTETAGLLGLDNVAFVDSHAIVDGALGSYSIHLGSASVHQRPGGALCIIPVHSQHRGRLFLPFADDDPKTAEVVSKVVMLARDTEIEDPTILEQLVG